MKITATTGGKSASTTPKRPSWADMKKHYPALDAKDDLYKKISKALYHDRNEPAFANTCAFRMSYALIRSGINLPWAPPGGTQIGDDKKKYWMRVRDFLNELPKPRYLGNADHHLTLTLLTLSDTKDKVLQDKVYKQRQSEARSFLNQISKKNGVIIFRVSGWDDAQGHCTLWEGASNAMLFAPGHDNNATNLYYFWLTIHDPGDPNKKIKENLIQTHSIDFWELR